MSQFSFEHQGQEIAADRAGSWQAVFRTQRNFGCETESFPVNRSADYRRYIFMFGDKGTRYDNVITRFRAALGNPLTRTIDFSSPQERACSAISARAWRASRLRCLRNNSPSFASLSLRLFPSAYWRRAARKSAALLRRRDDVSANSSKSFRVASSMVMVFMERDYINTPRSRSRFATPLDVITINLKTASTSIWRSAQRASPELIESQMKLVSHEF